MNVTRFGPLKIVQAFNRRGVEYVVIPATGGWVRLASLGWVGLEEAMATGAIRVRLLGPVEASCEGLVLPLGGARRAELLALLALGAPHVVGRAQIVDGLWGEDPPASAVNAIQVHVSALRKVLGPDVVLTVGEGYRLDGAVTVDAAEFQVGYARGLEQLAGGDNESAAAALGEVLELWAGPALSDLGEAPALAAAAAHLEGLRTAARVARVEADLALGRHEQVVPELQLLLAGDPLHEKARELLMRALYYGDRQGEALAVYDAGRRILRDELGVDPSPGLRALHQRLLAQTEVPPPSTAVGRLRLALRLPVLLDETLGRDHDLQALQGLLSDGHTRLVTVLGPGGVGKTRLSIELGHRLAPGFRDGAAFVPLAEAKAGGDVAAIICSALGLSAGEDAAELLLSVLPARQMLLICDNFEHVTDAAALLSSLLGAAPGLRVLATSRQRLGLRGEQQYRLEPLPSSGAAGGNSPAAELFVARARTRDPRFAVDADDWSDIEQICVRCDGLPLAIELAAARSPALGVGELLERMSEPLLLLGADNSDVPDRHRTLRASLAWSIDGLPDSAQRLLPQLTVFRGGFTLAAAAAVAALNQEDALAQVETLLDHSLLHRTRNRRGGHRFDLLETVRQYAADLLTDDFAGEVRQRHAQFFRSVLSPEPEPGRPPATVAAWNALVPEQANLRVAIDWALGAPDGVLAEDLVVGATGLWDTLGPRHEMSGWTDLLMARSDISPGRRADVLFWKVLLSLHKGATPERVALADALKLALESGDTRRQSWVIGLSAWLAALSGDQAEAQRLATRAATLAQDHPQVLALQYQILNVLALVASHDEELERFESALQFCREHQMDLQMLNAINNVCEAAIAADRPERARDLAAEGMAQARELGPHHTFADLVSQHGLAQLLLGEAGAAKPDLLQALAGHLEEGSLLFALDDILRIAAAEAADQPQLAAKLLGLFDAANDLTEAPALRVVRDRYLSKLPTRLGAAYDTSYAHGQALVADLGLPGALATVAEKR